MRFTRARQSILTAAISLALHSTAFAQAQQESTSPLDEIVVTANRIPVPLRQIATSVSVITEADIAAHGNFSISDVLRQLPAIATSNNGGAGKSTSLRIRGEEGFRTLTILDGMRLSDTSSPQIGTSMEHLMSSGISRVEILRGPQGLSYGADAGGILNISTRQSQQGSQLSVDTQAGKFGTRSYVLNAGGANDTADFFISLAQYSTDGFNTRTLDTVLNDDDGYKNATVHLRGGLNLTDTVRVGLVHREVEGNNEFDSCFNPVTFATQHDCTGTSNLDATRASLDYTGENFSHSLAYATTDTERDNLTAGVSTFGAAGKLERWEYVGSATNLAGFDLVFGADQEEVLNNDIGRDNLGVYAEIISDFSDNLYLTAGIRHDDNDDFGTNTSERFSAAYLIDMADNSTLKFKGSYGSGFRAPSPFEISYNTGPSASPPASGVVLKQETSEGYEAGVEFLSGDDLRLEATYFDQDVEDAIIFDLVGFSGYLQDSGVSNSKGIEISGEYNLNSNWSLNANYTHNETEQPNGRVRLRRPEDLFNIGASFHGMNDRLNVNAFYRISKTSFDQSGASLVPLEDFDVLDMSVTFAVTDNIQVYGRLENALDDKYQEILTYNTPGRAGYIGFMLSFTGF